MCIYFTEFVTKLHDPRTGKTSKTSGREVDRSHVKTECGQPRGWLTQLTATGVVGGGGGWGGVGVNIGLTCSVIIMLMCGLFHGIGLVELLSFSAQPFSAFSSSCIDVF